MSSYDREGDGLGDGACRERWRHAVEKHASHRISLLRDDRSLVRLGRPALSAQRSTPVVSVCNAIGCEQS